MIEKFVRQYNIDYTDGRPTEIVEVEIDLEYAVLTMGSRAIESKSGKCRDGPVTVKHVRKKDFLRKPR